MINDNLVHVVKCEDYGRLSSSLFLPVEIFECVKPGHSVIIKPNWVLEAHINRPQDWEYVITHPKVISIVIEHVLKRLDNFGRITIIDGPITEASFSNILKHYPVREWQESAKLRGVVLEVIDLRDHEWRTKHGLTVQRISLPGDPKGKVLVDLLGGLSEFFGHSKSKRGYYGADYDMTETNRAHDGNHNLYSVSRTVLEGNVFINIPKLKTHRKAGITACLKNLVGINTYKNYLPHHSEGSPSEGGDQFEKENINAKLEGPLISFIKQHVIKNQLIANLLSPLNPIAKYIFGTSDSVIRNGSWYGNDTLWRMVLDLNKILFYAQIDGVMCPDVELRPKHYIGIVDAVLAGEGEGPLSPDPVAMGCLICGTNPVAIDVVCAVLMGFDPNLIPTISNALKIKKYILCRFGMSDIKVAIGTKEYNLDTLPFEHINNFTPSTGWKGHIEAIRK